jgi:glutaredoxin/glutathione-dependent peroxiredoxin
MTISIGERVPDATLKTRLEDGPAAITTQEIFAGRKVVLFGVPGAFTPTCTMNHLPGFLEHNEAIRAKGVDTIAVVAANDVHVMNAWAKSAEAGDRILFLADGNADFIRALGLDMDMSAAGMGTRSKRFSMVVENGVVTALNVEDSPGKAETSGAQALLDQL